MRTIGNLIWLVLNGIWMAIGWAFAGVVLSITIIGIPFGRQCFKFANFALWPFGRTVVPSPSAFTGSSIGNIIWVVLFGIWLAIGYVISGIAMMLTIIGIPFGIQSFKFVPLALFPFGKEVISGSDLRDDLAAGRAAR